MLAVFVIVILFATCAGATCGMGGGVIIKPVLDALSPMSAFQINFVSSMCVLAMALSSLVKHVFQKKSSHIPTAVAAACGAFAGGVAGEFIFEAVENAAGSVLGENADALIKITQNSVLALLLVGVLVYMLLRKEKGVYLPSAAMTIKAFAACCVLGVISTFLGIGGGPINVCVLCLVLRTDTKEVTFYSLLTVMFAQVAKLFKLAVTGGFTSNVILDVNLEWWALVIMVAAAVIGGLLGAVFNKRLSSKAVNRIYYAVIGIVIALNIYNIIYNAVTAL